MVQALSLVEIYKKLKLGLCFSLFISASSLVLGFMPLNISDRPTWHGLLPFMFVGLLAVPLIVPAVYLGGQFRFHKRQATRRPAI